METTPTESVRARLMETNNEFRRLVAQHSSYDRRLEDLAGRRFPSQEEQTEEARLKKMKLHTKDLMQGILQQHVEQPG